MAQHDGTIDNGTGNAVRTDINNALAAINSNNSGASDPSTTFAYQFYADTGDNTLKIRNAANDGFVNVSITGGIGTENFGLAPLSGGTFTGDVTFTSNAILDNQADIRFEEATANGSNYIALQAPAAIASNVTLTLPAVAPTAGQALLADSSTPTTLTWGSAAGVGGDTGVDFNDDTAIRFGTGNDISLDFDSATNAFDLVCGNGASILLDSDDDITIRSDDEIQFQTDGTTTQAFFSSAGLELVDDNTGQGENGTTTNVINFHDTDTSTSTDQVIGRIDFEGSDSSGAGVVARIQGQSQSTSGGGEITFKCSNVGSPSLVRMLQLMDDRIIAYEDLYIEEEIRGVALGTSVCVLREKLSHAANAGTFTSGADRTRVLNTEEHDGDGFCSLDTSTGEFTLPAGNYLIYFAATAFDVNNHRAKIVTDGGTDVIFGNNVRCAQGDATQNVSVGFGYVSNASSEGYFLKHRCQTTKSSTGFGQDADFGTEEEFYATVVIFRMKHV
tara:strand:+ start:7972 stop:9477 length:1506 start_codon:yes stop_codon:yes gene_type:complete